MLRLRDFILSSASLVASQVVTTAVGFVFWIVATRAFSQSDVGLASATLSGLSLVGAIGAMGLGTLLIYEIPRHPGREAGIIAASLLASGAVGGVLGIGFVLVTPLLSSEFAPVRENPALAVAVAAGAGLTAMSLVADQAVVGLLRSSLQLVRNVVAAVVRLALLAAAALLLVGDGSLTMVAAWVVSVAVSLAVVGVLGARGSSLQRASDVHWTFLGRQWLAALKHHALNLGIQVPGWVMPLVAVTVLSASTNAAFFMSWQLVGFASFVQVAVLSMFYAAASRDQASLPSWGWLSLRLIVAGSIAAVVGLWLLGPFVLGFFGPSYAEVGREALVALPLTLFPAAIKGTYVTIHRVHGTVGRAAAVVGIAAVLEIAGSAIGASLDGLRGLGIGLLLAMLIEILPMLPAVIREVVKPALLRPRPVTAAVSRRGG